MDRDQISRLAHADHPIAAPIDDDAVARLLELALARGATRVLDLGCGGGEWLLRALAMVPTLTADGVDVSEASLAHARAAATRQGVADRLTLHQQDAAMFVSSEPFDLVLSVGSTHAFGGLLPALDAMRKHLAPGGQVLVGEGYWDGDPTPEAVEMLGELKDLPSTVDEVVAAGWTPVQGHLSTRAELDGYEWAWTGSLSSWALDHPDDPDAAHALDAAAQHRDEWLTTYRDVFGFGFFLLRPTTAMPAAPSA